MKNKLGELVKAPSRDSAEYTHPGVDLVAPQGSSIFPLADGVVVQTVTQKVNCAEQKNKGNPFCYLGFMLRLKHGRMPGIPEFLQNLNFTIYLHMDGPPTVQPGELVLAGTEVGKVGNTGSAQGYHTHFELRHFPGQLLEDKSWAFPFNIYGAGDQTKSRLFQTRWEDPQRFLDKLSPAVDDSERVSLEGFSRGQDLPVLPVPFYDPDVCLACAYREWQAKSNVPIYKDRRSNAPVVYTVKKGEWVTALTGGVVVSKPGEVEFRKKVQLAQTNLSAEPGDMLSILYYSGEGFYEAWFKGVRLSSYDLRWFAPGKNFCSSLKVDCSEALEGQQFTYLAGELRREPETTWWVQVKNRAGQIGWTNQLVENFDNKDALGSRDLPPALLLPPTIIPQQSLLGLNRVADNY